MSANIEIQVAFSAPGGKIARAIVAGPMVDVRDAQLCALQSDHTARTQTRDTALDRRPAIDQDAAGADPPKRDRIEPRARRTEQFDAVRFPASLTAILSALECSRPRSTPGRAAVEVSKLGRDRHRLSSGPDRRTAACTGGTPTAAARGM